VDIKESTDKGSGMRDAIRELIFYKGGWFVVKMFVLLAVICAALIMFFCELINFVLVR